MARTVERRVFEYWCPAACYLPMSDYRFYLPAMRSDIRMSWYRAHKSLVREVKERIRKEGPLSSADFDTPINKTDHAWGGQKPEKHALA